MLTGMILAAGHGSRLGELTAAVPKPMLSVGGIPVLEHNVRFLARFDIRHIVVNLHHRPALITSHFGDGEKWGVRITYSYETVLLGTAGGAKRAVGSAEDTVVVVYGDNVISCDLDRLLAFHRASQAACTVALFHREDGAGSGVAAVNQEGRIERFSEKPGSETVFSHWVNAGVLVIEPRVFQEILDGVEADFGRDVLPALLARGERVFGYRMNATESLWWIDTPDALERTRRAWESRPA